MQTTTTPKTDTDWIRAKHRDMSGLTVLTASPQSLPLRHVCQTRVHSALLAQNPQVFAWKQERDSPQVSCACVSTPPCASPDAAGQLACTRRPRCRPYLPATPLCTVLKHVPTCSRLARCRRSRTRCAPRRDMRRGRTLPSPATGARRGRCRAQSPRLARSRLANRRSRERRASPAGKLARS